MELGSNEKKALTHTPLIEAYFTYTSRKKLILYKLRKRKIFSLASNKPASKKPNTTHPGRGLHKPKLLLSYSEFLFETTLPSFSYKKDAILLCSSDSPMVCHSLCVFNCHSYVSPE